AAAATAGGPAGERGPALALSVPAAQPAAAPRRRAGGRRRPRAGRRPRGLRRDRPALLPGRPELRRRVHPLRSGARHLRRVRLRRPVLLQPGPALPQPALLLRGDLRAVSATPGAGFSPGWTRGSPRA